MFVFFVWTHINSHKTIAIHRSKRQYRHSSYQLVSTITNVCSHVSFLFACVCDSVSVVVHFLLSFQSFVVLSEMCSTVFAHFLMPVFCYFWCSRFGCVDVDVWCMSVCDGGIMVRFIIAHFVSSVLSLCGVHMFLVRVITTKIQQEQQQPLM